jgi:hypothetical protein
MTSLLSSFFVSKYAIFYEHLFPYASPKHPISPSIPLDVLPTVIPSSADFDLVSPSSPSTSQPDLTPSGIPSVSTPPINSPKILHRSIRSRIQLSYLQEYHCQLAASPSPVPSSSTSMTASATSCIPFSLSFVLSYDKLSSNQKCFSLYVLVYMWGLSHIGKIGS